MVDDKVTGSKSKALEIYGLCCIPSALNLWLNFKIHFIAGKKSPIIASAKRLGASNNQQGHYTKI